MAPVVIVNMMHTDGAIKPPPTNEELVKAQEERNKPQWGLLSVKCNFLLCSEHMEISPELIRDTRMCLGGCCCKHIRA
jgi:hypothetical protein